MVNGVGAAGVACSKIIMAAGVRNIIGCDQTGAIYRGRRENMNWVKDWYAQNTNPNEEKGTVHEVIKGADVFLGLSVPGVIDEEDVKRDGGEADRLCDGKSDAGDHAGRCGAVCRGDGDGPIGLSEPDQ